MGITVKVIDAIGIKRGGPANHAMHLIALVQQELRKIRPILSCNAGDKGFFQEKVPPKGGFFAQPVLFLLFDAMQQSPARFLLFRQIHKGAALEKQRLVFFQIDLKAGPRKRFRLYPDPTHRDQHWDHGL